MRTSHDGWETRAATSSIFSEEGGGCHASGSRSAIRRRTAFTSLAFPGPARRRASSTSSWTVA